jgi:hypothetical protein
VEAHPGRLLGLWGELHCDEAVLVSLHL